MKAVNYESSLLREILYQQNKGRDCFGRTLLRIQDISNLILGIVWEVVPL